MTICIGRPHVVEIFLRDNREILPEQAIRFLLFLLAPYFDGLFLHSAGALLGNRTIILCGPSDAGKTTACLHAPSSSIILSDEHILCRLLQKEWMAHPSPFSSDGYIWNAPLGYTPIDAVFLLERGKLNLQLASSTEAAWAFIRSSIKLGHPKSIVALQLVTNLSSSVPIYKLSTNSPNQVWPAISEALRI